MVILCEASGNIEFPEDFINKYHTHIYCHSGIMKFIFKNNPYTCSAGEFVFWFADSHLSQIIFTKNFTATVLFIEKDFLDSNVPDISWSIDVTIHSKNNPVLHLDENKDKQKVLKNFKLLYDKFLDKHHLFYAEIMNMQMQIFILEMWHVFSEEFERKKRTMQSGTLFERFIQMVEEKSMTERTVKYYANDLNITAKHLNFICKQNSGISASEWIQQFVRERLIILLENQNLNIAEIADKMEFSSRSFFTRYVKKMVGMTPTDYRNRLE